MTSTMQDLLGSIKILTCSFFTVAFASTCPAKPNMRLWYRGNASLCSMQFFITLTKCAAEVCAAHTVRYVYCTGLVCTILGKDLGGTTAVCGGSGVFLTQRASDSARCDCTASKGHNCKDKYLRTQPLALPRSLLKNRMLNVQRPQDTQPAEWWV